MLTLPLLSARRRALPTRYLPTAYN